MNDELKKQIEQEADNYSASFKYGGDYRKFGYYDGATAYATRAITAEQEVERLKAVLKDIKKGLNWIENSRELDIIHEALTPKPTTNDTE